MRWQSPIVTNICNTTDDGVRWSTTRSFWGGSTGGGEPRRRGYLSIAERSYVEWSQEVALSEIQVEEKKVGNENGRDRWTRRTVVIRQNEGAESSSRTTRNIPRIYSRNQCECDGVVLAPWSTDVSKNGKISERHPIIRETPSDYTRIPCTQFDWRNLRNFLTLPRQELLSFASTDK